MQGLVNFAGQIGNAIAILLPTFSYLAAIGLFLSSTWGFWMQAQPHNPYRGRPWVPFVALLLSGAFASFPFDSHNGQQHRRHKSAGPGVGVDELYRADGEQRRAGSDTGRRGGQCRQVVPGIFPGVWGDGLFFRDVDLERRDRRTQQAQRRGCGVQFVFGIMLINIVTVSSWLVAVFKA